MAKREPKLQLNLCFGTGCFIRGAQQLYTELSEYVKNRGIAGDTDFKVSFCGELCDKGPILTVNGVVIEHCTLEKAAVEIERIL